MFAHRILGLGFTLIFLFTIQLCIAQRQSEIEQERKQIDRKINVTKNLLNAAKNEQTKTIEEVDLLQSQIEHRSTLILNLKSEVLLVDSLIMESKLVIESLERDLIVLEEEYGEMMRHALRQKLTDSKLLFLVSSESFTDIFRRWQFLKRYQESRQEQLIMIAETKKTLKKKIVGLEKHQNEKSSLLIAEEESQVLLAESQNKKSEVLLKLKSKEKQLRKELFTQNKNKNALEEKLNSIVLNEIDKKKKSEKSPVKPNANSTSISASKTNTKIVSSSSFSAAKGKLDWPVKDGIVVRKFGTQAHPTLKGITISNNGIDIKSIPNAEVKVVFAGEILQIQQMAGFANVVVIDHGIYYTVYSNLGSVAVNQGDKVSIGSTIGHLLSSTEGEPILHFEVWKEKSRLNPAKWIKKY